MDLEGKLEGVPALSGVYLMKDAKGRVIYIGKAKSLRDRLRSHFQAGDSYDPKNQVLLSRVVDFDYIVTDSDIEALILEANLIKEHKPRYNVRLKDDKKFPFIKVTIHEDFPRIFPTRNLKKDGSLFFGPYTNAKAMRKTLRLLKSIFPIRSCQQKIPSSHQKRPCLNYYIQRCLAPCEGRVDRSEYHQMVKRVLDFLSGKSKYLIRELKALMEEAASALNFERAAKFRDQLRDVESVTASQKMVFSEDKESDVVAFSKEGNLACAVVFKIREGKLINREHFFLKGIRNSNDSEILTTIVKQYYLNASYLPAELFLPASLEEKEIIQEWLRQRRGDILLSIPQRGEPLKLVEMAFKNAKLLLEEELIRQGKWKGRADESVAELKKILHLSLLPYRIEAFDISNILGTDAVGSMVVFENGRPKKEEYRRFKIQTVLGQDDFAMMREVIKRRFTNLREEKKPFPDLVLVDGGRGQLNSALDALRDLGVENQAVLGLAKRLDEIYLPEEEKTVMIPKTSSALRLLQRLRDEAHRFALAYHRTLRGKKVSHSILDEILGIGPQRKQLLLQHFGSVEGIRQATLKELERVKGITPDLATRIHKHLHLLNGS